MDCEIIIPLFPESPNQSIPEALFLTLHYSNNFLPTSVIGMINSFLLREREKVDWCSQLKEGGWAFCDCEGGLDAVGNFS